MGDDAEPELQIIIIIIINKKDGYRQQNVRQFLHILASPETIAVNVTQYQRMTDRRTDRRPACINNVRSMTDER